MSSPRPVKKVLADLKASILNTSLTSNFQCWFFPPPLVRSVLNAAESDDRFISLSCAEAGLPGTSLTTHELTNDHTGVTERHAYRRTYTTTSSFTFYVDKDYTIINFFEKWIGFIVNEGYLNQNQSSDDYFYRVNFPKEYQTAIYIKKFERDFQKTLEYKFLKAYPISIDTMPVSYEQSQLLKCTVNFNFSRYLTETSFINSDNDAVLFSGPIQENGAINNAINLTV